ncbi:MAG: hypothetical protein NC127_06770 [Muribaculum sp.]|nr:hypothetical protein [Muribaculum sp.]
MGFWSFMRDMLVFDWLFGHRKKESFWEQRQRESQRYAYQNHHDDHHDDYRSYGNNDYIQQEFFASKALRDDDDLDSGMFDGDF